MTNTEFIAAVNGVYIVNDNTESTKRSKGFQVLEDTIIESIKVNGNPTDVKADYISSPATVIKAGALITAQGDDIITGLTLTSGSVSEILV